MFDTQIICPLLISGAFPLFQPHPGKYMFLPVGNKIKRNNNLNINLQFVPVIACF